MVFRLDRESRDIKVENTKAKRYKKGVVLKVLFSFILISIHMFINSNGKMKWKLQISHIEKIVKITGKFIVRPLGHNQLLM